MGFVVCIVEYKFKNINKQKQISLKYKAILWDYLMWTGLKYFEHEDSAKYNRMHSPVVEPLKLEECSLGQKVSDIDLSGSMHGVISEENTKHSSDIGWIVWVRRTIRVADFRISPVFKLDKA